jgi:transcription initiation factor IIE alpha subunit
MRRFAELDDDEMNEIVRIAHGDVLDHDDLACLFDTNRATIRRVLRDVEK